MRSVDKKKRIPGVPKREFTTQVLGWDMKEVGSSPICGYNQKSSLTRDSSLVLSFGNKHRA